ncbi:hypothetical protein [Luteipulveratus halotolerans]|uniref:Heavy metal-binding domain-containing protein n=1 Tax=Luteipulveratus halotolerans TaxID=1631356 RepID=A0A0L6CN66_9MICO|nr:hypothetical protein [Luteipulveratus halotolerans]KNX38963.1 hypothetical protein VV01_20435 [Luteipulveratus halotolerans]
MSGDRTAAKVGGFAVGLAAVFGVALLGGKAIGPLDTDSPPAAHGHGGSPSMSATDASGHAGHGGGTTSAAPAAPAADVPGGLQVAQAGYRLSLDRRTSPAGTQTVGFSITGPDGKPVTRFDVEHEKRLHLIAVRRDLTGFQHVHPTMDAQGRWTVPLDLSAGQWRVFADFTPTGGPALTLGEDLDVAGAYQPAADPGPRATSTVDGYTVQLTGSLAAGRSAPLTLSVSKAGKPVNDLQPYLGAYGHLVALRSGDLAYLHVHPSGTPGDGRTKPGPTVTFEATAPSAGDYRLYLDFKHGNVVRTAELVVRVGSTGTPAGSPSSTNHEDTPHAH